MRLRECWWVGVLAGISAVVGFRALVRSDEGRIGWDRFQLMIPGYGRVIRHRYYAQFSRTGNLDRKWDTSAPGARSGN